MNYRLGSAGLAMLLGGCARAPPAAVAPAPYVCDFPSTSANAPTTALPTISLIAPTQDTLVTALDGLSAPVGLTYRVTGSNLYAVTVRIETRALIDSSVSGFARSVLTAFENTELKPDMGQTACDIRKQGHSQYMVWSDRLVPSTSNITAEVLDRSGNVITATKKLVVIPHK